MKTLILATVLTSFSAIANVGRFEGNWNSEAVNLIVNQGNFTNCESDISIVTADNQLFIASPVIVRCDNFTFWTETEPMNILEGGILSSNTSGARGKISDDLIEIFTPNLFPDGAIVDSQARLLVQPDDKMAVELELEHDGYILDLKGLFNKN